MLRSMTGFASATGSQPPHAWKWDLRAVNGKGQDLRLRVPDWIPGLEIALRRKLATATARGNISLSLRFSREETGSALRLNEAQAASVIAALTRIETLALEAGLSLAPSRAADIASLRGVLDTGAEEDDSAALAEQLLAEADALIAAFNEMRGSEGAAIASILSGQLAEIEGLTAQARALASERGEEASSILRRNLSRVMDNAEAVDATRIAHELALIAVKADVTEEIDRLAAHVEAAKALVTQGGPVGRKLDFLMQEFNREANTLCSKAQSVELTRCGLALKTVIDQMREQVQNVE
jgi:uncharacterized protein (TIGR00255 family)